MIKEGIQFSEYDKVMDEIEREKEEKEEKKLDAKKKAKAIPAGRPLFLELCTGTGVHRCRRKP